VTREAMIDGEIVLIDRHQPIHNGTPDLLTVDEVAARLACSRRTIYRLIAEGRLASLLVRNTRRIRDDELERFVRAAEEEAKAS
jgi:excisionase family DNA binding protein